MDKEVLDAARRLKDGLQHCAKNENCEACAYVDSNGNCDCEHQRPQDAAIVYGYIAALAQNDATGT